LSKACETCAKMSKKLEKKIKIHSNNLSLTQDNLKLNSKQARLLASMYSNSKYDWLLCNKYFKIVL